MKTIAIFASGGGSNFQAIHEHIKKGKILGKIRLVISNNANSGAIKYAEGNNIPALILNKFLYPNTIDYNKLFNKKIGLNLIILYNLNL